MITLAPGTNSWRAGRLTFATGSMPSRSSAPTRSAATLFRGKRGDYLKGLYWDGTGLCLFAKRLEKGRFVWPPIIDRNDADAGAVGAADRGNGLEANGSTAGARATNADLTGERFASDSFAKGGIGRIGYVARHRPTADRSRKPCALLIAGLPGLKAAGAAGDREAQVPDRQSMQFGRSERITRQIEQLELQRASWRRVRPRISPRPTPRTGRRRSGSDGSPHASHCPSIFPARSSFTSHGACTCPDCGAGMAKLGEDVTESWITCRAAFRSFVMSDRSTPARRAM